MAYVQNLNPLDDETETTGQTTAYGSTNLGLPGVQPQQQVQQVQQRQQFSPISNYLNQQNPPLQQRPVNPTKPVTGVFNNTKQPSASAPLAQPRWNNTAQPAAKSQAYYNPVRQQSGMQKPSQSLLQALQSMRPKVAQPAAPKPVAPVAQRPVVPQQPIAQPVPKLVAPLIPPYAVAEGGPVGSPIIGPAPIAQPIQREQGRDEFGRPVMQPVRPIAPVVPQQPIAQPTAPWESDDDRLYREYLEKNAANKGELKAIGGGGREQITNGLNNEFFYEMNGRGIKAPIADIEAKFGKEAAQNTQMSRMVSNPPPEIKDWYTKQTDNIEAEATKRFGPRQPIRNGLAFADIDMIRSDPRQDWINQQLAPINKQFADKISMQVRGKPWDYAQTDAVGNRTHDPLMGAMNSYLTDAWKRPSTLKDFLDQKGIFDPNWVAPPASSNQFAGLASYLDNAQLGLF